MEVAGLHIEAGGDGRQRREPLAVEQPTGLVHDAESAIILDTVQAELDIFALLDPEPFDRRDMQPRDLHETSLSHWVHAEHLQRWPWHAIDRGIRRHPPRGGREGAGGH